MTESLPPERPLDLRGLLGVLAAHDVDHIVVGGVAVQVHGHRRTTKDLDVIPAPDAGNMTRLASALSDLEARQAGLDPSAVEVPVADAERLALAAVVPPLLTRHGELHVLKDLHGLGDYDGLRQRALVVNLEGLDVAIIGLEDLVRAKRASGRPRDLEDVEILVAVERAARREAGED